jgi:hypothetical protein
MHGCDRERTVVLYSLLYAGSQPGPVLQRKTPGLLSLSKTYSYFDFIISCSRAAIMHMYVVLDLQSWFVVS